MVQVESASHMIHAPRLTFKVLASWANQQEALLSNQSLRLFEILPRNDVVTLSTFDAVLTW